MAAMAPVELGLILLVAYAAAMISRGLLVKRFVLPVVETSQPRRQFTLDPKSEPVTRAMRGQMLREWNDTAREQVGCRGVVERVGRRVLYVRGGAEGLPVPLEIFCVHPNGLSSAGKRERARHHQNGQDGRGLFEGWSVE